MSGITIWHNPRCSKSRQALALLRERGVNPAVVEYLKQPPSADDIREVLNKLGLSARDLLRKRETAAAADAGLTPDSGDAAIIAAMAAHPILIERPVVIRGGRAVIGRPTEAVASLLD